MKRISWIGNSLNVLRGFPADAKYTIGTELLTLEYGHEPSNTKATSDIGAGVRELRVQTADNHYRIIYVTKYLEAIYVLHCFIKKSNKISKKDLGIAKARYKVLLKQQKEKELLKQQKEKELLKQQNEQELLKQKKEKDAG